jgi:hypothetical protein
MTLYTVQLFAPGAIYSQAISQRLMPRHRAQRVVSWFKRRGRDAYAAPARVTK